MCHSRRRRFFSLFATDVLLLNVLFFVRFSYDYISIAFLAFPFFLDCKSFLVAFHYNTF